MSITACPHATATTSNRPIKIGGFLPCLRLPASGPHINSVTFLTPFALLVQHSNQQQTGYSAPQAPRDHHANNEIVALSIQILLAPSYGPVLSRPTSSGSSTGVQIRPSEFWKDFDITVLDGQKKLTEPAYFCDDGCILSGAIVHLEFPAQSFMSSTVIIQVAPPDGHLVLVVFDPTHLR